MVYNLCLSYTQNAEDAEELTQDVFVKIHSKLAKFQGNSSLKTWIYRIAVNQCLDFIKMKGRKKRSFILNLFSSNEPETASMFNHPGIELENKEAYEALFLQINSLSGNQKTALILKYVDDLPQKEVAEIMELSPKAVESLLQRAKGNLKNKLNSPKD